MEKKGIIREPHNAMIEDQLSAVNDAIHLLEQTVTRIREGDVIKCDSEDEDKPHVRPIGEIIENLPGILQEFQKRIDTLKEKLIEMLL